jgi:hypothetical protein
MATSKRREIEKLKLDDIVRDVAKTEHWTPKDKREALRAYRAYLSMRLKRGRRKFLAIDEKADKIWHVHIVNTVRYKKDCNRIFGRYLDHTPLPHPKLTAKQKRQFDKDLDDYVAECATFQLVLLKKNSIPICT